MSKHILQQQDRGPSRVDGVAKVTGKAKYAAEYGLPGLVHGYLVSSTVAKGKIREIDTSAAEKAPGVIKIISYKNSPKFPGAENKMKDTVALQSNEIFFNASR